MEEVPQNSTRVHIYTDQFIIDGEIGMFSDTRMTDYIISAHEFIAVTNARVFSPDKKILCHADFLNIQKNKIVIIVPETEIKPA